MESSDPALAELLRAGLDVPRDEARVRRHVHGFHSYPARMHPDSAARLIAGLSAPGERVLDPFCGSGTVLVEARALGRAALGSDLNPLAVALSRLKTAAAGSGFAAELASAAERVAEHARARQKAKLGPTAPYGPEDRALFETYVLLELDGLRDGIDALGDARVEPALRLVHSALLTKVSHKAGDSAERERPKRIARGFAIRFFCLKAGELGRKLEEYAALVPPGTPAARVEVADARRLGFVRDASVRLVLSSPPYPGVYDYLEHHRARLRWLRLDARGLERGEIGARRRARPGPIARRPGWEADFVACFTEIRRVLQPGGHALLLVGDSVEQRRLLRADEWLPRLAAAARLRVTGRAAQLRPHFHEPAARANAPRREHLFALEPE